MTVERRAPEDTYAPVTGGRGRRLMELEFGKSDDFDDPGREWRRLFSELLGTFLLVLAGAGARWSAPSRAAPSAARRRSRRRA